MVPTFRVMQERIDSVNRVLREQITGVRVVRAFVREPEETERFDAIERMSSPRTSLRAGRLMALMMPSVMLVMNISSVAVIWFGANRIADGTLSLGVDDRVPQLPHADPHGRDDGDLDGRADPSRRGVR